ncbi:hypothetical protein NDK50_12340 [Paraburkholderia bryophila]|uniref:hypothetical protein n=1 Tax=Paraburkholderia bryophila TaxID=420952 RepID=UPI00234BCB31|nr:hypothetical protein [Paraburkholderia bryophila]WCM18259.1 hypothetical protein NDK50_12340 [Paraburkholderia bryophila]
MKSIAAVAVATCLMLSACGGDDVFNSTGGATSGSTGTTSTPGSPTNPAGGASVKAGWSAPATVDGKGPEFSPAVTVDAQGNALALWMTNGPNGSLGNEVWSSRYVPGTGWATPVRVDTTDGTYAMNAPGTSAPVLVGSADGHAVALWQQFLAGVGYGLWARPYDPASGWGTAVELSPNETSYAWTAGVDGKGNAIVAWQQKTDVADTRVFTSRYTVGGTWSSPAQIVQPVQTGPGAITGIGGQGIDNVELNLSVTSAGNAVLAWRQKDNTQSALWATTYDTTNGWANATPVVLEPNGAASKSVFAPAAGMDAKGNLMLVWGEVDIDSNGPHTTTMSERYLAGSGWQTPQPVAPFIDTTDTGYYPQLAVNDQGLAAVTWIRPDGTLQASTTDANGTWGPTQQLTAHVYQLNARQPEIVMDAAGNATVTWQDVSTANSTDVVTSRYTNGAWGTATLFGQQPQDASWPAIAVNASGVTALVWEFYKDGTVGNILESSFYTPGS